MTIYENSNQSIIIRLNVGGTKYARPKDALEKCQKFKSLLATGIANENDEIFIDRDGFIFRYVLQYLRTGELHLDNIEYLQELKTEAKFYEIASLEKVIGEKLKKKPASPTIYRMVGEKELKRIFNSKSNSYKCPRKISSQVVPENCGKTWRQQLQLNKGWNNKKYTIAYDK